MYGVVWHLVCFSPRYMRLQASQHILAIQTYLTKQLTLDKLKQKSPGVFRL